MCVLKRTYQALVTDKMSCGRQTLQKTQSRAKLGGFKHSHLNLVNLFFAFIFYCLSFSHLVRKLLRMFSSCVCTKDQIQYKFCESKKYEYT